MTASMTWPILQESSHVTVHSAPVNNDISLLEKIVKETLSNHSYLDALVSVAGQRLRQVHLSTCDQHGLATFREIVKV